MERIPNVILTKVYDEKSFLINQPKMWGHLIIVHKVKHALYWHFPEKRKLCMGVVLYSSKHNKNKRILKQSSCKLNSGMLSQDVSLRS